VLADDACRKLRIKNSSEVHWEESFPPSIAANAPRLVLIHGMNGSPTSMRRELVPFLLAGKVRCEFVQAPLEDIKKSPAAPQTFSWLDRDEDDNVVNPMRAIHNLSDQIKARVKDTGQSFDGILAFSQGSILSGLMMGGIQSLQVPAFQESPLKFAIMICGSALDWRTMAPRCFEAMPIRTPALVVFGKGDLVFGTRKQKNAFTGWFFKSNCTRFEHPGLHQCFPPEEHDIRNQIQVMLQFVMAGSMAVTA